MDVWESIFNAYWENSLFASSVTPLRNRHNLESFVDNFITDPEKKEQFERLLDEFCVDIERHCFHAGLRVALRLYSE